MTAETRRENGYLQIGEVAERTGVTQRTLRFYEEKGLLKPPTRMEGGFRLYSQDDIQRVERIRQLQKLLGFSLAEIKEMVEAEEVKAQLQAVICRGAEDQERRARVLRALDLTEKQHAMIRQKVEQLQEMQQALELKLTRYHEWLNQLDAAGAEAESRPCPS